MKLYQRLTSERKATINSTIDELNERYRKNGSFDFNALCTEKDIRYYEHIDIVQPIIVPRIILGEDDYMLRDSNGKIVKHGKRDIFNFPFKVKFVREHLKSHEIAHIILNHQRETLGVETEANYFARKLTRINLPPFPIDLIGAIEVLARNKKMVEYYAKNDNSWGELYIADLRKLAEKIQPIHNSI